QLLWRHRRAKILQEPIHKATVEDVSWAAQPASEDCEDSGDLPINELFKAISSGNEGRMSGREWRSVIQLVQKNPVLNPRIQQTEVEGLVVVVLIVVVIVVVGGVVGQYNKPLTNNQDGTSSYRLLLFPPFSCLFSSCWLLLFPLFFCLLLLVITCFLFSCLVFLFVFILVVVVVSSVFFLFISCC
ncbi:unnamed protein product, partial [Polarella glacialis]